jgi:hypothetical protein
VKINIKLKLLFTDYINTRDRKESFSVSGVNNNDKDELLRFVDELMNDDAYFVYKKGSTKFNDKLEVVLKKRILEYFNNNYIIYSIDTLDLLMIGEYSGFNKGESVEGIDIDATGKFKEIIQKISQKFKFDVDESKLPTN